MRLGAGMGSVWRDGFTNDLISAREEAEESPDEDRLWPGEWILCGVIQKLHVCLCYSTSVSIAKSDMLGPPFI